MHPPMQPSCLYPPFRSALRVFNTCPCCPYSHPSPCVGQGGIPPNPWRAAADLEPGGDRSGDVSQPTSTRPPYNPGPPSLRPADPFVPPSTATALSPVVLSALGALSPVNHTHRPPAGPRMGPRMVSAVSTPVVSPPPLASFIVVQRFRNDRARSIQGTAQSEAPAVLRGA